MTIFGSKSSRVISDPMSMNYSTTPSSSNSSSPGRWCPPASNASIFMSSSPLASCCQDASPGVRWSGQGNDITSQLDKRDWQRRNLSTNPFIKDTTSSPARLWAASFTSSTQNTGHSSPFGGGGSNGSSQSSGSQNVSSTSSVWSSSSRNCRDDRLMQMD